jgi:hypothetical protein
MAQGSRGLARVRWHRLKVKEEFDWKVFAKEEEKMHIKKLARLQNLAASLNYQLTPLQGLIRLVSREAALSCSKVSA